MQLFNKTKETLINNNLEQLGTVKSWVGLIGKKEESAVFFRTRFGIHTFGVRFPIDILVLNSTDQVVKIKEVLFPQRIFFWNPKYNKIVELPSGLVKKTNTQIGDKLIFQ